MPIQRQWRERLDQFLRLVGAGSLITFGGLFVLTLLAPIPPFPYWLSGPALYQALAFLFAGVVGVFGLKNIVGRKAFWILVGCAVLLTGFAWWTAADQSWETAQAKTRGLSHIALIGALKEEVAPNGEWSTTHRIHVTGSNAQTGVVLRFYGPEVRSLNVVRKTEQKGGDEEYPGKNGAAYAHYILFPIGLYDIEVTFAKKAPVEITYTFEDGRTESARVAWATKG